MNCNNSIVEYFGPGEGHSCGYCKSSDTNFNYGLWGHILKVEDYQDLIDRGWRRSGCYLYRPRLDVQCCPMYTIKCDALNFKLSNSQKKVIKNVNRYLNFDIKPKNSECHTGARDKEVSKDEGRSEKEDDAESSIKNKHVPQSGVGADASKPRCKKAKLMRMDRKNEKMKKKNERGDDISKVSFKKASSTTKSLEDHLCDIVDDPKHKLRIELISCEPSNENLIVSTSHQIYMKYQTTVHHDLPSDASAKQFSRFLVTSPLYKEQKNMSPEHPGYGSFHQQYWIDDTLVAVGVVDILPGSVSSVYLFYDPQFSFLSLGTYTALREITFVRKLQVVDENLSNYYMGFYIHSCPKMTYKAQFSPSFLLCPETFTWHPTEKCVELLDSVKYNRFAEHGVVDEQGENSRVENVLVLCGRSNMTMTYSDYLGRRQAHGDDGDRYEVKEYARIVGKCSQKVLLFRK